MSAGALLFDLDGTLVDSARGIAAALNRLRDAHGEAPLAVAEVRRLVALGAPALIARGLGNAARDPAEDLASFRAELAALPPDPAAIYPGAAAALDRFAHEGRRMAVVTNKPERLARALLDGLGLARRFETIVGGDSVGAAKPSPAPVRHAMGALGVTEAHFIGDSAIDAAAAAACGLPFLLFTGGYGAAGCDAADVAGRFDNWDEVAGLLAERDPL